ncbi:MAG: DinB family protein [Flavobacterium sp.]|uniref:DinB family protein n=1 Tax=Flavobacterium sp. TaxID=239 RepID=UPI0032678786
MKQEKWFDRSFNFENSQNIFPSILERLSGTPIRLEEKVIGTSENILTFSLDDTWSIKENIGHLIDLEPLWQGRLIDIINDQIELRATDLQNSKTDLANHNDKPLQELLSEFRKIREQTIKTLQSINEETIFKSALHPRLKTPMRTIDLFLFVAEHDDHHLARIAELITGLNGDDTETK